MKIKILKVPWPYKIEAEDWIQFIRISLGHTKKILVLNRTWKEPVITIENGNFMDVNILKGWGFEAEILNE